MQPENIQPLLNQVRNAIRAVLPDVQERISWPYAVSGVSITSFIVRRLKSSSEFIPVRSYGAFFRPAYGYKTSKGAVQFPYDKPLPLPLIAEIAKWCYETENHH